MEIYDVVNYETFVLVQTSEGPDVLDMQFNPIVKNSNQPLLVREPVGTGIYGDGLRPCEMITNIFL